MPERIRALVYVSAFLLEDGATLGEAAARDPDSLVLPSMRIAADGHSASILESAVRDVFYGLSSAEDVILGQSLLRPEPLGPISTPIRTTGGRFGRVPRMYIECAADRALTPAAQRRMQAALPCRRSSVLQADHSPFFSAPLELVNLLTNAALEPF
jgi:pimeloyl-ACP methyl ester carboxylesterase